MAVVRVPATYIIECDNCQREWYVAGEDQVGNELVQAALVGWNCLQALDGGDCLCQECRAELSTHTGDDNAE